MADAAGSADFGQLGQKPEDFERQRIRALDTVKEDEPTALVVERFEETPPALAPAPRAELTEALKPLVAEAFAGLATYLTDLQADIRDQTRLLGTLNVPLEAVADSHERASASFETLRKDIAENLEENPALARLAKVIDTAGLADAQSRAELRMAHLAQVLTEEIQLARAEMRVGLFSVTQDMNKILSLLERLQERELRRLKRRATLVARAKAKGKKA